MAATEGENVKLIGAWASPYVVRAGIALALKGVEFELLQEEFGKKSETLIKSNPVYKKMPVLLHGGRPICESLIIVQYVDDVWAASGPAIFPADPYEAALHRFWAFYIDDKWWPSVIAIRRTSTEEAKAEAVAQAFAGLKPLEEAFEQLSKGRGFFGGDNIGYLDIALGCCLGWAKATARINGLNLFDGEQTPLLAGWAERFCAHEAVRQVMPETELLMELSKLIQAAASQPQPSSLNP